MENQKQDEEEQMINQVMHSSLNIFRKKKNLSIEKDKKVLRKRSSSMLLNLNLTLNLVPQLKPLKTIICPSPINLNQKSPKKQIPELQSTTISTSSFDSQNDCNQKFIKFIYSRRKIPKKSFKFLNIEEEVYPVSDNENNSQKIDKQQSDSDTSKSDEENESNKNKYNKINKKKYQNINIMRKKMEKIRKRNYFRDNLLDNSDIGNRFKRKILNHYENIERKSFIKNIRENKNLMPFIMNKYRTKSFNLKPKYVSTILGFLEKNNSTNTLNSNGK